MTDFDRTILIVEDDDLLRDAFKILLEDAGYQVLEAATGAAALETAQQRLPALIILDMGLPDRSGIDVVRSIRLDPDLIDTPVIALTGRVGEVGEACLPRGRLRPLPLQAHRPHGVAGRAARAPHAMKQRRWDDPRAGWLHRLLHRFYRLYYRVKYSPFAARRKEQSEEPGRGFVGIQIDALAFQDLEQAMAGGHMPFLRRLIDRDGWELRRYPAGLPSATPAAQASIFHGTKDRIPAFRFYEKGDRRVLIGSQQASMQYIRDRLPDHGILDGGSSYVNLYDGGADRAVWTLSDRNRRPFLKNLGGGRVLLLLLLHPVRTIRMGLVAILEYFREERDRLVSQMRGQSTHYWWYLPFLHIGTNVVLRELQTLSVLLDIHLGVPAIYTTYNAYDEFAHHFGPSSRTAYKSLRAVDRRIKEIFKAVNRIPGRPYDVYILSDHGQTPSVPYRIRYNETLGDTIKGAVERGVFTMARTGEYAPPREAIEFLVGEMEEIAATSSLPTRKAGLGLGRWIRRHYNVFPLVAEVVRPLDDHDLVVTYSSSLAHVYWTDPPRPLGFEEIRDDPDRRALHYFLVAHRGRGCGADADARRCARRERSRSFPRHRRR